MALSPGTRLGPYEVSSQIGAGGMGEVYAATDVNLGRQVAIKVLPEAVAADVERLARFDREAKTLASLNHPNIAVIYGLERASGITALVLELVEGPTIADRLAEGPIPIDEALIRAFLSGHLIARASHSPPGSMEPARRALYQECRRHRQAREIGRGGKRVGRLMDE